MKEQLQLPTYPDEYLAELSPAELADPLIEDEDRIPRNTANSGTLKRILCRPRER